jgi:hypothetical protein
MFASGVLLANSMLVLLSALFVVSAIHRSKFVKTYLLALMGASFF